MKSSRNTVIVGFILAVCLVVATVGLASATENVSGTLAADGDTIVLDAADGFYLLEGSDMTPDMVGKHVTVTGTIEVKNDLRVIKVLSMEEAMD